MKKFKPNLIPNNPKDGSFNIKQAILKNGNYFDYMVTRKKDGCRLQLGLENRILTRSLKEPKSKLVIDRFSSLNKMCLDLNISVDGEFYMHGLKFNEIFRFFSNTNITSEKYINKLTRELNKDVEKFFKDYNGKSIMFLSTFHHNLKFWLFDGIVNDRPDLIGYRERMAEIVKRIISYDNYEAKQFLEISPFKVCSCYDEIMELYNNCLQNGYEGLVLTHKNHEYKFGRTSINVGTILKMKDDAIEFDGVVLDVLEGTEIKDGIIRGENELGSSTTSKKKGDRKPNGKAKGFLVEYEGLGNFIVGLRDFNDEQKKELLENKGDYIGNHFKYTAMNPVKDFPRSAYFACWRDEK